MKVCSIGLDLPEGKIKYHDDKFLELVKKCDPLKITPFYVEFIRDELVHADAFVVAADKVLDLLILDMEKLEGRRDRTEDDAEKALLARCLEKLEEEEPLCDGIYSQEELALLKTLAPLSLKPTLIVREPLEVNEIVSRVLAKADTVFFYTVGKKEVHAWPVPDHADIVTCAGKIHTDLARGFIKADIVKYEDFVHVFNMQEARAKKLVHLVDRDYHIEAGDIVEIRFNV
jgi:ribosome-binding ATPase YchF (GTP1/OBG family)